MSKERMATASMFQLPTSMGSTRACQFPVLLAPSRRAEHLQDVMVRNLRVPQHTPPLSSCFYRLYTSGGGARGDAEPGHGEKGEEEEEEEDDSEGQAVVEKGEKEEDEEEWQMMYESECSHDVANPIWLPLESRYMRTDGRPHSNLLLRVYGTTGLAHRRRRARLPTARTAQAVGGATGGVDRAGAVTAGEDGATAVLLLEKCVDLCQLFHLNLVATPLRNLPMNTVIYRLSDGFYGRTEQWRFLRKNRMIPQASADRGALAGLTISSFFDSMHSILARKRRMQELAARTASTKRRAAHVLARKHAIGDRKAAVVAAKKRIEALRRRVASARAAVIAGKESLATRRKALQARAEGIRSVLAASKPSDDMRKAEAADVANERQSFRMARQMLTARQLCLVSDVRFVYPINVLERYRSYSIRGIVLPASDLATGDDELVSTGLGHVAHLVCLVSKYLQVPLRYSIHCMGSRSTISDDVLRPGDAFPLYAKTDRQRFAVAVRFLQSNISQLLVAAGVRLPAYDNSHMLAKLVTLFAHLLGPVLAFETS